MCEHQLIQVQIQNTCNDITFGLETNVKSIFDDDLVAVVVLQPLDGVLTYTAHLVQDHESAPLKTPGVRGVTSK